MGWALGLQGQLWGAAGLSGAQRELGPRSGEAAAGTTWGLGNGRRPAVLTVGGTGCDVAQRVGGQTPPDMALASAGGSALLSAPLLLARSAVLRPAADESCAWRPDRGWKSTQGAVQADPGKGAQEALW